MNTNNSDIKEGEQYIYSDITYKIIRGFYNVYNKMGYGYREKEYQKGFEEELKLLKLNFVRELYCYLTYEGRKIAKFYLDFLIEDKIVVELKVADEFYKKQFDQVMTYLKTNNLQLGLIAIFTSKKVLIKRVINQLSA